MVMTHKQQLCNSSLSDESSLLYRFFPLIPSPVFLYISYWHLFPLLLPYFFVLPFMFHPFVINFPYFPPSPLPEIIALPGAALLSRRSVSPVSTNTKLASVCDISSKYHCRTFRYGYLFNRERFGIIIPSQSRGTTEIHQGHEQ
jgi:hypothetical protein